MLSRRQVIAGAVGSLALPKLGWASAGNAAHGYSVVGALKYGAGFRGFDYVNADAPKGGAIRLTRIGAFDTANTLRYPGRPPTDIRLVYDRLMLASEDEVASYYGVLAENLAVADDFSEVEFFIDGDARWQDGRPVTAQDVEFTLKTLAAEGAPYYRQVFRPVSTEVLDDKRILVRNERVGDRDLLRKLSTIPIHPEHLWRDGAAETIIGSGPLRVVEVDAPRRLVLARDQDYWGASKPANIGRWNFDRVEIEYYRDANIAFEAFKADEYDVHTETNPTRWQTGYAGPAFDRGDIERTAANGADVGTLMGLVFNMRRSPLNDRRVREALVTVFNFEPVNSNIFSGAYAPFGSVFAGTALEAVGAASTGERDVLSGTTISAAALSEPDPLAGVGEATERDRLRRADALLAEAGFSLQDGQRVDADRTPLRLEVLVAAPAAERAIIALQSALSRIGVELVLARGDSASLSRRMLSRDFDLATLSWSPARLPGTAERLLWHSALADAPQSYALSGLKSDAVDAAIEALERARTRDALATAGRAFDRAFRHELALLPLWRNNKIRIAWWDRFGRPEEEVQGFPPSPMDRWWSATG